MHKAQKIAETVYGDVDNENLESVIEVIKQNSQMDPTEPLFHKKERKISISNMLCLMVGLYNGSIKNSSANNRLESFITNSPSLSA